MMRRGNGQPENSGMPGPGPRFPEGGGPPSGGQMGGMPGQGLRGPGGGPPGGGPPMGGGPMGGMRPGMMGGEKPKSFRKALKTFLTYLKPFRFSLIIVFVFAIASTVFAIIGPKLLGNATTRLFEGAVSKAMNVPGATIDFEYIGQTALLLLVLYLLSAAFNYIQGYIMSGIAMKITYQFRKEIAEKIKRLPLKYFDTKTHGEVQSRVANDIDTISMTLTQNMTQIVTSVTTIVGILIMMLTISWLMTLVALVVLPISAGLVSLIVRKSQKYFRRQQAYLGHVNGHVEEMYGGHIVMKAFNGEEKSISKFNELNEELYVAGWKSQFLSTMMMPIMTFVGNLSYVLVSALGGYLAIRGSIGVGDILAFIQYVRSFTQPIAQVANIANVIQATAASAERVFEFLDEEEEIPSVRSI
jgi:ATP-binding cassette subfamily B multidrug efflux pump